MANNIVYKYRTNNNYALNILTKGELWFSDPKDFNDPFDCKMEYTIENERRTLEEICLRHGAPKLTSKYTDEQLHVLLQKSLEEESLLRVLSLSEDELNILMWSHYADYHKGFCIGIKTYKYNNTDCIKIESGQIKEKIVIDIEKNLLPLIPVHYSDTMPKARDLSLSKDDIDSIKNFITWKSSLWSYEKEQRILLWSDILLKQNVPIKINKKEISEIIFGVRMPKDLKDNIIHIASDYEVKPKIYQCEYVKGKYAITKKEISY